MHWYLFPFSLLYRSIVSTRNKFFDWGWIKSNKFDIPIISVGNITVGGTGKTPHIEYLIRLVSEKYSVGNISRGYKRKTKGFVLVTPNSKAKDVGDEPLQIKQKYPHTTVVVDEKRVHAVNKLISTKKTPKVILLDDAYQHRHITPGLNILLVDYSNPITKDHMLPVGRLREPAHNSNRANVVILTKCPKNLNPIDFRIMDKELNLFPYQKLFFTCFTYSGLVPLFGQQKKPMPLSDLKNTHVLVVTGIANPKPIYSELEKAGAILTKLAFPDHYDFKLNDINKITNAFMGIKEKNKVVLCTEKDAVRFKTNDISKKLTKLPFYSLPIEVEFLNGDEENFKSLIDNYINCTKTNSN